LNRCGISWPFGRLFLELTTLVRKLTPANFLESVASIIEIGIVSSRTGAPTWGFKSAAITADQEALN
jgi:hypothetical protein